MTERVRQPKLMWSTTQDAIPMWHDDWLMGHVVVNGGAPAWGEAVADDEYAEGF